MADMPKVEETTTPAPSAETENQETTPGEDIAVEGSQPQSPQEESPAESGYDKRLRRQSEKIKRMGEELDHWKNIASRFAQTDARAVQTPSPQYPRAEVDQAISTLKQAGMVTKDELNDVLTRLHWDQLHTRNESQVNSNSNLPKYNRDEVEEYARDKGISDPMAAYRDMYFDEIVDSMKRNAPRSKSMTTERPSKPNNVSREPLTLDSFREKLQGPDGAKFYEELAKDPAKFDHILKQLAE
jgi:hypothetical protein